MRRRTTALLTTTALLALAAGATATAQPIPGAAPAPDAGPPGADLQYVRDLPAPEDLVRVPGAPWVLVSSLAGPSSPDGGTAALTLVDTEDRTATSVVPEVAAPRAPYDACAGPPDFSGLSTQGLHVRSEGEGRATLFAVGHGSREGVEVFDVASEGDGPPRLTWTGCVPAPAGSDLNAVVALADGRLVASDFLQDGATFEDVFAGRTTGAVQVWEPGGAFEELPGTRLSGPNGLAVTRDQRYLVVAESGTSSVLRYRLAATEEPPVVITTDFRTDNLRRAPDGRLLLAGPRPDPACDPSGGPCAETSVVGALDPRTMDLEVIAEVPPVPEFSGLSSALVVGDELWLGTATGDRVAVSSLR